MTKKLEDVVLDSEKFEANTEWCDDVQWQKHDGTLPVGVWRRLAAANRSLFAANRIAEMLVQDARGKEDARDDERVVYTGLAPIDAEALRLAMIELGHLAEEHMAEVRDAEHGCWGTLRAHA